MSDFMLVKLNFDNACKSAGDKKSMSAYAAEITTKGLGHVLSSYIEPDTELQEEEKEKWGEYLFKKYGEYKRSDAETINSFCYHLGTSVALLYSDDPDATFDKLVAKMLLKDKAPYPHTENFLNGMLTLMNDIEKENSEAFDRLTPIQHYAHWIVTHRTNKGDFQSLREKAQKLIFKTVGSEFNSEKEYVVEQRHKTQTIRSLSNYFKKKCV